MKVELSPTAKQIVMSLAGEGMEPAAIVESALLQLHFSHSPVVIDPDSQSPITGGDLTAELRQGLEDETAGHEMTADFDDIIRRGRERLNARRSQN